MHTTRNDKARQAGSVMLVSMMLMGITSLGVGSLMLMLANHRLMVQRSHARDRAFYLAESGVNAAIVRLNEYAEGNIAYNESRAFFSQANAFEAADWGFQTSVAATTGTMHIVTSTGRLSGQSVTITAGVALVGGSRRVHALYAHALYAGNSSAATNYILQIGGTGTAADFVMGDVYSGYRIEVTGDARLRLPELLNDIDGDKICAVDETWAESYVITNYGPMAQAAFVTYSNSVAASAFNYYRNGRYDRGEAFRDIIGDGIYQEGEPFTDTDGDGVRHPGDSFTDLNGNGIRDASEPFVDNGNGVYDTGEEWVEDAVRKINSTYVRKNGKYDPAGGYWKYNTSKKKWVWTTSSTTASWPAEVFEDLPDGVYYAGEPFEDGNGVCDAGERFVDDRNRIYDYGTQATGLITGMPAPGRGQRSAPGGDPAVDPPDLVHMYYHLPKTGTMPADALPRWGHDYPVNGTVFGTLKALVNQANPAHIFVRNPPTSGSVSVGGKTINGRQYTKTYTTAGVARDDYFFEDPTDSTYNTSVSGASIDGTTYTAPMYVTVLPAHNLKVYFVDGNLYIHHPNIYSMRFRNAGTRITIVVKGNITLSDEFYYNARYPVGLTRENLNSTVVKSANDAFCLIAIKDPNTVNSGNIYLGDAQFGTGGGIHALLYAENDFVDNNLNTSDQGFLSIYGNMTAGNHVRIVRSGTARTRLDITLDERIREGSIMVPGLPHPVGYQRCIQLDTGWGVVAGTWGAGSRL